MTRSLGRPRGTLFTFFEAWGPFDYSICSNSDAFVRGRRSQFSVVFGLDQSVFYAVRVVIKCFLRWSLHTVLLFQSFRFQASLLIFVGVRVTIIAFPRRAYAYDMSFAPWSLYFRLLGESILRYTDQEWSVAGCCSRVFAWRSPCGGGGPPDQGAGQTDAEQATEPAHAVPTRLGMHPLGSLTPFHQRYECYPRPTDCIQRSFSLKIV